MEPDRLGKYEVRGTLGKGAMGTVYSGWDPVISRKVAIKTVRLPDAADIDAQEELARFKREAQAAGRLTHPNIVGIFDYGETEQVAYIVMEFVEGQTLKGLLDAGERLPIAAVARVMGDVLAGLHYSHERGVVHRDIKPANIMIVGGDGHGSGRAKIADFGIARIESSNLTQAGTIMGTPAYMSPEQFMGQTVDARTDIYSSGVLLFQLLTGERPFEGSMATIMHKALNTVPPKPSELSVTAPRSLDAVVAKAMARRPEDRHPTAAAFAEAITAALEQPAAAELGPGLGDLDTDATVVSGPAAKPQARVPAPAAASTPARSRALLLAGAGVAVLAVAGGGGWFALSGPGPTPNPAEATRTPPPAQTAAVPVARVEPPVTPPPIALPPPASPPPSAPISQPPPPRSSVLEAQSPPAAQATPEPRQAVTQVVPPTTTTAPAATTQEPRQRPVQTAQPAKIVPPVATEPQAGARRAQLDLPPAQPAVTASPQSAGSAAPPVAESPRPPAVATATPTQPAAAETARPPPAIASTAAPVAADPAPRPAVAQEMAPETHSPAAAGAQTPVATASAALTPEALRRAIGSAAQSTDCALIGGDVARNGTIALRGVVGRGKPEQDLLRNVRDAAPTAAVDWGIGVADGPYCGALNLIRSYARSFGASAGGIEIGLKDGRTELRESDRVDIRGTGPDFPAYVEVDYFSSDGTVAHLRKAATGAQPVPARGPVEIAGFEAAPPYGTDVIIAVAASTPLFGRDQALSEKTDDYLRELRAALEAANRRKSQVASGAVMVRTSPRS